MNPANPIGVQCIGVIGLGYVGLSLATAFGRVIPTIAFDIDRDRIQELQAGHDSRGETPPEALKVPYLSVTSDPEPLPNADFLIVTVPTPVDRAKRPDLSHLIEASRLVGRALRARSQERTTSRQPPIIVYESTVYPGCTEEVCVPVLEQESGLRVGKDFKVGYSPERINPGDSDHTLDTVVKIVAGQDEQSAKTIEKVYGLVVRAGVYRAPDIKTAEAAKVIENIQRDLNIALMNELAMLFHRIGLDIHEVLRAARTKWNFLPFDPGLVGGHCIPVDPYYLTHKAQEIGYHPEVILAGRRINDFMGVYVAQETVKLLIKAGKAVRGVKVLVLGATFKENVRDIRNTRVVELVKELENHGIEVEVYDPMVDSAELQKLGLKAVRDPFKPDRPGKLDQPDKPEYEALVIAVPHRVFREKEPDAYLALLKAEGGPGVLVDIRGVLSRESVENARVVYWSI
jgi:UDP-N-acetyl-D-galactosamine dehydrogenase